jgi:hypothetical protein
MEQVFRPPDYLGDLRSHDDESECAEWLREDEAGR